MKKELTNEPMRVSLNEMYDLFERDEYADYHSLIEKKSNGERYVSMPVPRDVFGNLPLLYQHIIAEQLFNEERNSQVLANWFYNDEGLQSELVRLWMYPLMWIANDNLPTMIVDGRVAIESYDYTRSSEVRIMIEHKREYQILRWADNPDIHEEDYPEEGMIKGFHFWDIITWNCNPLYDKILDGGMFNVEDFMKTRSYDAVFLRQNLQIIASKRGKKRAAEILRLLQNEWPIIKRWNSSDEHMTYNDKQEFEDILFHGFDDLLAEWEKEESIAGRKHKLNNKYPFVTHSEQATLIMNKISEFQEGKTRPIDLMKPIRAAMEAGAIRRPSFEEWKAVCPDKIPTKTSFSDYTNLEKKPYYDNAYKSMVEDFKKVV